MSCSYVDYTFPKDEITKEDANIIFNEELKNYKHEYDINDDIILIELFIPYELKHSIKNIKGLVFNKLNKKWYIKNDSPDFNIAFKKWSPVELINKYENKEIYKSNYAKFDKINKRWVTFCDNKILDEYKIIN